ncbi:MAG: D-aminoacylase domain protein [Gemmatimonadetes bacterium]|nr:D-aminoacylase domain protein [Gemmatimonadota bacterium]
MRPSLLLLALLGACASTPRASAPDFDVVIAGGRIVDGTGRAAFAGDVAIRGDRIVAITEPGALAAASAGQRIEARGQVVAPGFIDIQAQSEEEHLVGDGRVVSKLAQGVTTEILGEGTTLAPASPAMLDAMAPADSLLRRASASFVGPQGFAAWLAAMERHGSSVNVGSYLGAANPRIIAKGYASGAATPAELDTMRRVVRDAMRGGAFGVASALIYPPGSYASTAELAAMAEAMAPLGGTYVTHIRSEDDELLETMDEALRIGRDAGVPVVIYHLKAAGTRNWHKAAAAVAKIDSARAAGQRVSVTMYPYPASANTLASCIPTWASADGRLLANLRTADVRARIEREMADTARGAAPLCQIDVPGVIMVVGLTRPELVRYEGWRLDRIAADMRRPWTTAIVDLLLAQEGRVGKITFSMSEANVAMQLRRPWVVIGSDAGAYDPASARGLAHPRAYGTYPRVLGRYVREEGIMSIEEAVRRMTSATASLLGIGDRGRLAVGTFADVVVFDPRTIADRATYEQPHQLAVGVSTVLVNGTAVWRDGAPTGALPGRALRGPGTARAP